jgi:hypothetical protein
MQGPKIITRITNDTGLAFNVRLVQKDDRYGLDDCLVHDQDEPLVEFWDATYENDPRFTLGLGQFASRYYLGTLTGKDGHGVRDHRLGSPGLDLCGHVSEWKVTGANVMAAIAAAEAALAVLS